MNIILELCILFKIFIYSGLSRAYGCMFVCPPYCNDTIPNGRYTLCLYGRVCSYECNQGYETTTEKLTCKDGFLKPFNPLTLHDRPLCEPKPCNEVIPNGNLLESCTSKVGWNCEYTCDVGYSRLRGVTKIKCDSTTNWSTNPHFLCTNYNQCPYEIPGADLDLSCRRRPGEKCMYTCREGYVKSHYATADCGFSGKWMQRIDSFCIVIKCPLFLAHGTIQYPCTRKYGETCSYKCYDPYTKSPLISSLKCNASRKLDHRDTTGYWEWNKTMDQPCVRKEDFCPSTFPNGNVSSECHRQPGAVCSYTCNPGCDRNTAVAKIYCRQGQSGGTWLEDTDTLCTNCIRCPGSIDNGQVLHSCDRLPFTDCAYTCNYGCFKANITTLYCNDDGLWNNPRPACICSDWDTVSGSEDTGSPNNAFLIAIIAVVMVVFMLLVLSSVCLFRYRHRQRMNRPNTPTHENENREPMIPSAPP